MQDKAEGFAQMALLRAGGALFSRPAHLGALSLLFAATSPDAQTGVFLGPSLRKWDRHVHPAALVAPADDRGLAGELWRVSEDATAVHYLDAAEIPGQAENRR